MRENKFTARSQNKAKTIRLIHRNQMFERNRKLNIGLSYSNFYDSSTWAILKSSLECAIPDPLPPLNLSTISLYRRSGMPVFKTRIQPGYNLDPHMTYQSLWALAGTQYIEQYPDFQHVVKQFQDELNLYLSMPYTEIKQMAVIAAGNKILGKEQDIKAIAIGDDKQLWLLINHIYQRKISFEALYQYLDKDYPIVYQTIYQMTNNPKDQIIDSIAKTENILITILKACQNKDKAIQSFAIRIIGNILAQKQDYASQLSNFKILDAIYPALKSKQHQIRRQACWLISNYAFERAPAKQILCNSKLMQRLFTLFKSQTKVQLKVQLYYIFIHLISLGEKKMTYKMVIDQKLIDQCINDIEIDHTDLILVILNLIDKTIDLGDQFVSYQDDIPNIFINHINYSPLRKLINNKTFNQNDDISTLSFEIMNKLDVDGIMESDMI